MKNKSFSFVPSAKSARFLDAVKRRGMIRCVQINMALEAHAAKKCWGNQHRIAAKRGELEPDE